LLTFGNKANSGAIASIKLRAIPAQHTDHTGHDLGEEEAMREIRDINEPKIAVWDRAVRIFHWLLVLSVVVAAYTGFFGDKRTLDIHLISGTLIGALIVFRLIWGFSGSTYARFGSFVCSPLETLRHVRDLMRGRASHHIGHNPVGTAMILALLAVLTAIIVTGVIVLGGVVKVPPFLTFTTAFSLREVHQLLAFALVGLVALHVIGVVAESLRTHESLARAMVTGTKLDRPGAEAAAPAIARPAFATAAFAGIGGGAAILIAYLSLQPAFGVPTAPLDAAYIKECGSCHSPHHPSVASASTWSALMGKLDDHFGENASLSPELTARLTAYMTDNSAEKWDTWPANRLRVADTAEPLRITATRGWKRFHKHLPAEFFKAKAVGGKLNCSKCHADAETGRFAPRAIDVPH
jgi:cytochrome b